MSKHDLDPSHQGTPPDASGENEAINVETTELYPTPWTSDSSKDTALLYAEFLEEPKLEEHFSKFLTTASEIDGLLGLGFAVWVRPKSPPFFTTYALTDFRTLGRTDIKSPRAALADVYDDFVEKVGMGVLTHPLEFELSYINTHPDPSRAPEWVSRFPDKLVDPFKGEPDPAEQAVLPTVLMKVRPELLQSLDETWGRSHEIYWSMSDE